MREIKFRIYQPGIATMGSRYLDENKAVENLMNPFNGKLVFNVDEIGFCGDNIEYYADRGYIIEQYTGLKDKNDVEIYEGDIIKNTNEEYIGIIIYFDYEARYTVAEKEEWPNGTIHNSDLINEPGDHWMMYECEIIGNIHENPELLDKTK